MRRVRGLIAATAAAFVISAPAGAQPRGAEWRIPPNSEIAALLAARIAPRRGQGIVIGMLDPSGRRVIADGPAGGPPFDGDTVFEIGSISKVFTALILADMARKGEVALDAPAERYLPGGAHMPARGGRQISLRDLALHISGLPRLATNMPQGDRADPYADYTDALMLDFLAHYRLPRDISARFEYSNLGGALLGYLLARAVGGDYDTLLRERVTGPLGMNDTSVALSASQQARFAPGFDPLMHSAKPWRFVQPGAGGIHSTANDMLKFAAAALDPNSPIGPAMKLALAVRVPSDDPSADQALGWRVARVEPGREIPLHDGGTGGFRSLLALDPAKGSAV
ncbi:MAG TPA: serine hydrolase domain-containing protein, partial [Croceibacterium sp.]|nr:serine hydrolase domain-containing protein [Croceibacterium sp.]